jgi:UPF0755 protein
MEIQSVKNIIEIAPVGKKRKWVVFLIAALVLIIMAGLAMASYAYWEIFVPINKRSLEEQEFIVEKGMGVKEIATRLQNDQLIKSTFWFETYIWYKNFGTSLKAGQYSLSPGLNIPEITVILSGGQVKDNSAQITFPEGFTLKQIKTRLIENNIAAAQGFNGEMVDGFQLQYKFLSDLPSGTSLEGFLFPDTYRFNMEIKKEQIIKKFLDNFDKKLTPDLREKINRQGKLLYEIIILASIVQQEAVDEEEMPMIAGVFANRLRIGMPLESDATVNYITGKNMRQPLLEDTKIKSPYNTYANKGLPPTPICNPGLAAIKAAIEPMASDYLYFLHPLNQPAVFSKTLDEHNKNRVRYLK